MNAANLSRHKCNFVPTGEPLFSTSGYNPELLLGGIAAGYAKIACLWPEQVEGCRPSRLVLIASKLRSYEAAQLKSKPKAIARSFGQKMPSE
jgi:hypothetical protein